MLIEDGVSNMLKTDNQRPENSPGAEVDSDDSGVPASERGKGENMPWDKRHPSWVFGLVAGTFIMMMIIALLCMIAYLGVEMPTPWP
jgi:hypothetical protein